jgi:catechol 2,3-dioxygenase-like lactoylglutathione lyase family enzyme
MLLFLVTFVASILVQGAAFPALTWRRSRCAAAASSWLSMSVGVLKGPSYAVSDLERSIAFYSKVLGFKVAEDNRAQGVARVVLDDGDAAAMTVELLQQQPSSSGVTMGDAYAGIGVRVPSATQIFQSAAAQGGRVLLEVGDFAYAASLFPDEDEMRNTPVRCAATSGRP